MSEDKTYSTLIRSPKDELIEAIIKVKPYLTQLDTQTIMLFNAACIKCKWSVHDAALVFSQELYDQDMKKVLEKINDGVK